MTVEQLWAEKYSALHAEALASEEERRAEDFLDVTRTVCGLELRQLTPRDVLTLDYAKNPFIAGGEVLAAHIPQFLFHMMAEQPRGWIWNRVFFKHCAALLFEPSRAEISAYVERHFVDAPRGSGGSSGRPLGTSFVAPLIVRIAAGIPGIGPREIMDTPIPQLFQFQKVLAADASAKDGRRFRDHSPSDRLLAECLDEANRLNAEPQRAQSSDTEDTESNNDKSSVPSSSASGPTSVPSVAKIDSEQ